MAVKWQYLLIGFMAAAPTVRAQLPPNLPYDGRPQLARLRFNSLPDPVGAGMSTGAAVPAGVMTIRCRCRG